MSIAHTARASSDAICGRCDFRRGRRCCRRGEFHSRSAVMDAPSGYRAPLSTTARAPGRRAPRIRGVGVAGRMAFRPSVGRQGRPWAQQAEPGRAWTAPTVSTQPWVRGASAPFGLVVAGGLDSAGERPQTIVSDLTAKGRTRRAPRQPLRRTSLNRVGFVANCRERWRRLPLA